MSATDRPNTPTHEPAPLSAERREEIGLGARELHPDYCYVSPLLKTVGRDEILALLAAADECERLRVLLAAAHVHRKERIAQLEDEAALSEARERIAELEAAGTREDERRDVVAWLRRNGATYTDEEIGRGEHVGAARGKLGE